MQHKKCFANYTPLRRPVGMAFAKPKWCRKRFLGALFRRTANAPAPTTNLGPGGTSHPPPEPAFGSLASPCKIDKFCRPKALAESPLGRKTFQHKIHGMERGSMSNDQVPRQDLLHDSVRHAEEGRRISPPALIWNQISSHSKSADPPRRVGLNRAANLALDSRPGLWA